MNRHGLVLLACAAVLPGCSGLTQTEQVSVDTGYQATQAAMEELQFTITDKAKDALQARVSAQEADKTEVTVRMDAKGDRLTEFRVRVGIFGDESQSRLIMDKIKKHF